MSRSDLDLVDVPAEARRRPTEREVARELLAHRLEALAQIEPHRVPRLVADVRAVGQRLQRQKEILRLDGRLEIRDLHLVVDHADVSAQEEIAVEIHVETELVDGSPDVDLEHDLPLRLVDLGVFEIEPRVFLGEEILPVGEEHPHRLLQLVVARGDRNHDGERPRRHTGDVRERRQRQRIYGCARQGDLGRHHEGEILLEAVGNHRGPSLDAEHLEGRAPVRVTDGQIDGLRHARIGLFERRADVVRELLELCEQLGRDGVEDARSVVSHLEPPVGRHHLHLGGLQLHLVLGAQHRLCDHVHVERKLQAPDRHVDDGAHLRVEDHASLRERDLGRRSLPRVLTLRAEQREGAVALPRDRVVHRASQATTRHGDVRDDA